MHGYFYTNLYSAVAFVESLTHEHLQMDPDVFAAAMGDAED